MKVIGLCRSVENLPAGVTPLTCDLRDTTQIQEAFLSLDHLDILVNSAGLAYLSRLTDGDPALWEEMWQVNVHALSLCCQLALPLFPENSGQILNLSSMSGHRVPPTGGFYAATKFAVRAVSEALRAELKTAGSSGPRLHSLPRLRRHPAARQILRRPRRPAQGNPREHQDANPRIHRRQCSPRPHFPT